MTDKQIIINGIDVSKCNFRLELDNQQKCECCHATGFGVICDCEQWHNCYFKQLARAREEIEKLKKQIDNEKQSLQINIDNLNQACLDLIQENDDLQNKLQAKEQECENLKEKIAQIKCEEIGKETFFEYKIKNYKQVLDEIENLCKQVSQNNKQAYISTSCILVIINKAKEQ